MVANPSWGGGPNGSDNQSSELASIASGPTPSTSTMLWSRASSTCPWVPKVK